MIKAPKADEKPTLVENTAMAQHRPRLTMSSTSLLIRRRTERRNNGTADMPTTSQSTRKKAMLTMLRSSCPPSGLEPLAMAESITIITMASMSSSISTLITRPANCCWRKPRSSNALYIIVVLLMASMPPRKMQSMRGQPKACPTRTPSTVMAVIILMVEMMGEAPILSIFLNEKSRPSEKSRNITPMSAQRCMLSMSATLAV